MTNKLVIRILFLGCKPLDIDIERLCKWKSSLWEIQGGRHETLSIPLKSDLDYWGYSDELLLEHLPKNITQSFTFCVINAPLQQNYFSRRIAENVVCFTFYEVADFLRSQHIPLENAILRMLYTYTLIYQRHGKIPSADILASITHDNTCGCVFDMAGIKSDLIFSCEQPLLCTSCQEAARLDKITEEFLDKYQREIKRINKILYYRISDSIKRHPTLTLCLSLITALIIGIISYLVASFLLLIPCQ